MTQVLIVSNWLPARPTVFADTLRTLRDNGAHVTYVCGGNPAKVVVPEDVATVKGLFAAKKLPQAEQEAYQDEPKSRKLWLRARRDPRLHRLARAADVIVALDPNAVHTVWQLARRHRAADAVLGLPAALAAVDRRAQHPSRYAVRRLLGRGPSPAAATDKLRARADLLTERAAERGAEDRFLRAARGRRTWELVLNAPGLSDDTRLRWADRVAGRLLTLKLPTEAGAVRVAATRRMRSLTRRAAWLNAAAAAEFEAGRVPGFLGTAAGAELDAADAALRRDDVTEATRAVARVIPLMFNRAAHFDALESPSAQDPRGFLAPLHGSAAGRALAAPQGRSTPAAAAPTDRPHRLLFVTRDNQYFLTDIRARYEADADFEVRSLDLLADPEREMLTRQTGKLIRHKLAGSSAYGDAIREWLAPMVQWADTVFVDWCLIQAALLTVVDPGSTRIIVRLHSYEAFTVFPHLIDFSRVDDLVFVSEPLRDFTLDAVPRLRGPGAPRTPVVTNAVRLDRYRLPKSADARFTLGLIGLSAIAKDPRWAFEVLRELRRQDERYALVLIGKELDGLATPTAAAYHERYARDLAELEAAGAVRRVGQTDDVPGALTEVGVILSTSVRESFHLGLIEGAASSAVPVVRDWPFFAGRQAGARSIFPADWIVTTPQRAAERILRLTATEETWRKAGEAAAEHAMITWDWSVTQAEYDRLLRP
ncbi:glycosyltransferase family 1 protein [Actinoplanes sp. NPDC049599]|uniref:glycosyltransferase family 1 protein n=1 Tax=Actinoplanes sp. NPDC049599 TaxID=3363903 RepID=UPI003793EC44